MVMARGAHAAVVQPTGNAVARYPEARYLEANTTAARGVLARSLLGAAPPSGRLWQGTAGRPHHIDLFDLPIENTTLLEAARDMARAARDGRRMRVVFANAHAINTTYDDVGYRRTVACADRIFADGSGMAAAAQIAGTPLADNVNGTDLFPLLCREAISAGTTIFLLGGKPGIAAAAAQTIADFGMGASIAGTHHGFFKRGSDDEDRVIGLINGSGAGIVLVGFGVPLQDQWAERNATRLDAAVVAGVGGLFDFFAGVVSRSPKIMRSFGCEWMWRLAMEPRRMAYRYLIGNAVFLAHAYAVARSRAAGRNPAATAERQASRARLVPRLAGPLHPALGPQLNRTLDRIVG